MDFSSLNGSNVVPMPHHGSNNNPIETPGAEPLSACGWWIEQMNRNPKRTYAMGDFLSAKMEQTGGGSTLVKKAPATRVGEAQQSIAHRLGLPFADQAGPLLYLTYNYAPSEILRALRDLRADPSRAIDYVILLFEWNDVRGSVTHAVSIKLDHQKSAGLFRWRTPALLFDPNTGTAKYKNTTQLAKDIHHLLFACAKAASPKGLTKVVFYGVQAGGDP